MSIKIITSDRDSIGKKLARVYQYKSLIVTFAIRDLKIQYAQTFLGIIWSVLRPLSGLVIYTAFFGFIMKVDTGNIPYPLFAFSGMICWYEFSNIISQAGRSLIESQNIMNKTYFPKLILPLSKVLVISVDLIITLLILAAITFYYQVPIQLNLLAIPLVLLTIMIVGLALGIWLSALTVRFRDFHHIIPYLVNFGIFVTPIFYPSTLIPVEYHFLLYWNPTAGVVESMRWALFGGDFPSYNYLAGFLLAFALLISGFLYFLKSESRIADTV